MSRLEDTAEFQQCIAKTPTEAGPLAGDSIVILDANAGASMDAAVAAVEANGHSVVDRLDGIQYLNVDVGSSDAVIDWVCRYRLDEAYAGIIRGAWPNTVSELTGGNQL